MSEFPPTPEELGRETNHQGTVLEFETIRWRGIDGKERVWETVERRGRGEAVVAIPWLRPSNRLVLIRQWRPPARGEVIEFPAGIIDEGESPAHAARRELTEETGFVGEVGRVLPPTYNTPGLSGETVYQAIVEIDEMLPVNGEPDPCPDEGEHIAVLIVPRAGIGRFLRDELAAGTQFDSKVMGYLLGMLSEKEIKHSEGDWLSRLLQGGAGM